MKCTRSSLRTWLQAVCIVSVLIARESSPTGPSFACVKIRLHLTPWPSSLKPKPLAHGGSWHLRLVYIALLSPYCTALRTSSDPHFLVQNKLQVGIMKQWDWNPRWMMAMFGPWNFQAICYLEAKLWLFRAMWATEDEVKNARSWSSSFLCPNISSPFTHATGPLPL